MQDGIDISERELTRDELDQLIDSGAIESDRRLEVLALQRKSVNWSLWVAHWTAALGAVFLLAGVLFFFAWNWKELSPFTRFAVLEGSVVLATIGALFVARSLVIRQWLLTAAGVLTGVLVAVYGQVYQTGADAFEVFALWAVLMLGWVLVSRFAPLWVLWLAVVQTAVSLFFGQVLVPAGTADMMAMFLVLGLISAGSVAGREALETRAQFSWLKGEWIRVVLVASTLVWLSSIPWEMIFDSRWWNSETVALQSIGLLIWAGAVTGGALFFTRVRPSLTCVGLCLMAAALILVMWLGKVILDSGSDNAAGWLIVGILAILIFSGAAALIVRAAKFIAGETASSNEPEDAS